MLYADASGNLYRQKMYCILDEKTRKVVANTVAELEEKFGPVHVHKQEHHGRFTVSECANCYEPIMKFTSDDDTGYLHASTGSRLCDNPMYAEPRGLTIELDDPDAWAAAYDRLLD